MLYTCRIIIIMNASQKSTILIAFNNHFTEFIDDVQTIFPTDVDILTAKNSLQLIRKSNPKLVVGVWDKFIVGNYYDEIEQGNIDFFINKDYSGDLNGAENGNKILDSINRLRTSIKNMNDDNKQKTVKYIQNLTKLSVVYHQN